MHKILALFLILALACPETATGEAHTREQIRTLYAQMVEFTDESPYLEKPAVTSPYSPGTLTEDALRDALSYVNFLRRVAYLENDVTLSPLYTLRAQCAACLLAANDDLEHDAPIADGMDKDLYETAHTGTMSSNIACINWMDDDLLMTAVEYFVRDDGAENLETLGHRRWLLNPQMGATGFGLANSATGLSYAAMYAHDLSGAAGDWDYVAWPSRGAFPAELITGEIAWSISLNPLIYDVEKSNPSVILEERARGAAEFSYFKVDTAQYGAGPCVIFVPGLAGMGIEGYQQNQVWTVTLSGLVTADGQPAEITYEVEMMSLFPVDPAAVEVSEEAITMVPGDVIALSASVIPAWADDLGVTWASTDESVATVDESGKVIAISPGECAIEARAVNGRAGSCRILVEGATQQ